MEFNSRARPKAKAEKKQKELNLKNVNTLLEGGELVLHAFNIEIFSSKLTQGKGLKLLTPTQMFQKLPTALAQLKAGNTDNSLNKIRQILHSLCLAKETA